MPRNLRSILMFCLSLGCASAQVVLTGVARDFEEMIPKVAGGHPDFNPTIKPNGEDGYECFDKMDAARNAVMNKIVTVPDANPAKLAGFVPYERDEASLKLKPGYDTPPNCFRSRFQEWYTTHSPDTNRAFFVDLPFVKEGDTYRYDNQNFFPLDNQNLPNLRPQVPGVTKTFGHRQPGRDSIHNYGFTFEFHAKFTYKKNLGQNFQFLGDDDVWVYINDSLVIDLGGIHHSQDAQVNLHNLGLVDGKTYYLDFYFAERRVTASRLTITTSLVLAPPNDPDPPEPPVPPVPPVPPKPAKVVEGWLYDRDGDGIGDRAEIALDIAPAKAPSLLELKLEGEVERGDWDITPSSETKFVIQSKTDFFTKVVTGWDESAAANQSRTLPDALAGLSDAAFPLHDRIGPVIISAFKTVIDSSLDETPSADLVITFSEPVRVDVPQVLKFKDPTGKETSLRLVSRRPDSAVGGFASTWRFTIDPAAHEIAEGTTVAIGGLTQVSDKSANAPHVDNPYRKVETKFPKIIIGDLRAEKAVTASNPAAPSQVKNPFVLLTSKGSEGDAKTYVPLRPESAEEWIRRNTEQSGNPGIAVFGFKLSHPAELSLTIFDNMGHFVNKTKISITRQDLQSGLLARDPSTRAYLLRFAWYPISHDGHLISTGAYILRAEFTYGIDSGAKVERGDQSKVSRFGFMRTNTLVGLGLR